MNTERDMTHRTPFESPNSATSRRLAAQARFDTSPEIALRSEIWRKGARFRLHVPIPGTRRTIDIALPRYKIAVFVDGCFWHGCPVHGSTPKNNSEWWRQKLDMNRKRDADSNRRLKSQGWKVIRVWEHENPSVAAQKVAREIRKLHPEVRKS